MSPGEGNSEIEEVNPDSYFQQQSSSHQAQEPEEPDYLDRIEEWNLVQKEIIKPEGEDKYYVLCLNEGCHGYFETEWWLLALLVELHVTHIHRQAQHYSQYKRLRSNIQLKLSMYLENEGSLSPDQWYGGCPFCQHTEFTVLAVPDLEDFFELSDISVKFRKWDEEFTEQMERLALTLIIKTFASCPSEIHNLLNWQKRELLPPRYFEIINQNLKQRGTFQKAQELLEEAQANNPFQQTAEISQMMAQNSAQAQAQASAEMIEVVLKPLSEFIASVLLAIKGEQPEPEPFFKVERTQPSPPSSEIGIELEPLSSKIDEIYAEIDNQEFTPEISIDLTPLEDMISDILDLIELQSLHLERESQNLRRTPEEEGLAAEQSEDEDNEEGEEENEDERRTHSSTPPSREIPFDIPELGEGTLTLKNIVSLIEEKIIYPMIQDTF